MDFYKKVYLTFNFLICKADNNATTRVVVGVKHIYVKPRVMGDTVQTFTLTYNYQVRASANTQMHFGANDSSILLFIFLELLKRPNSIQRFRKQTALSAGIK